MSADSWETKVLPSGLDITCIQLQKTNKLLGKSKEVPFDFTDA